MSDPIADALARANAAAPAADTTTSNAVAPSAQAGAVTPGKPRSLEDAMATAGTSVDIWLGVKEEGIILDKKLTPKFKTIAVTIKPSEVKFGVGVRFNIAGRPNYAKSYDGVVDARSGKSWAAVVAEAMAIDPGCKGAYDLADIPCVTTEELDRGADGKLPVGKRLGWTTPVTGYALFMNWLNAVYPVYGKDAEIPCTIRQDFKTGPTGPYAAIFFDVVK